MIDKSELLKHLVSLQRTAEAHQRVSAYGEHEYYAGQAQQTAKVIKLIKEGLCTRYPRTENAKHLI